MADTLYERLGVAPSASAEEIKRAYRRLLRTTHPDGGGSAWLFRSVQEAWETLSDPSSRATYDAELKRGAADAPGPRPEPPRSSVDDLFGPGSPWRESAGDWRPPTPPRDPPRPQGRPAAFREARPVPPRPVWPAGAWTARFVLPMLAVATFWTVAAGWLPHPGYLPLGVLSRWSAGAAGFLLGLGLYATHTRLRAKPSCWAPAWVVVALYGTVLGGVLAEADSMLTLNVAWTTILVAGGLAAWATRPERVRLRLLGIVT